MPNIDDIKQFEDLFKEVGNEASNQDVVSEQYNETEEINSDAVNPSVDDELLSKEQSLPVNDANEGNVEAESISGNIDNTPNQSSASPSDAEGEKDEADDFVLPDVSGLGESEEKEDIEASVAELNINEIESADEVDGTYVISEVDFENLKNCLKGLPVNLKLAVEELITGDSSDDDLKELITLLVARASVEEIVTQVVAISGKDIILPRRFERKTGIEFEKEAASLSYWLRKRFVPLMITASVALILIGVVFWTGYNFVYQPLRANSLYRSGFNKLENEKYLDAVNDFDSAVELWPVERWFFTYAKEFELHRRYRDAESFYEKILERYGYSEQALLELAQLETDYMSEYEDSEEHINSILEKDMYNFEGLIESGDNYLAWSEEQPSRLEDARFQYATALQVYGNFDKPFFRMIRYFVHTGNLQEAMTLGSILRNREDVKIDVDAYTELADLMIDNYYLEEAQEYLFETLEQHPDSAVVHYQLARYFQQMNDSHDEFTALNTALQLFEKDPLKPKIREDLIDTHNRLGKVFYSKGETLKAESEFITGISLLEDGLKQGIFSTGKNFGDLYKNMGDIYYFNVIDPNTAELMYNKAELYYERFPADAVYKLGYINYSRGEYGEAIKRFTNIHNDEPKNNNLLFALGNTFYQREDYFLALGYFLQLLDLLEARRQIIPEVRVWQDPEHKNLIDALVKVNNNIGVTQQQLSISRADSFERRSEALKYLTESTELYDLLNRDNDTMVATDTKNFAYFNIREILYPPSDFELFLYERLSLDLATGSF